MPRLPASAPPTRHTADPARTRGELATLRPDLLARYDAELPGARAAILARLLGALAREPLPGLVTREPEPGAVNREPPLTDVGGTGRLAVTFAGGTTVRFPDAAAALFAAAGAGLVAEVRPAADHLSPPGPTAEAANVEDPGTLVRLLWPGAALAEEIDNSVANLALARAARQQRLPSPGGPPAMPSPGGPGTLAVLEQLVTDGHPIHPCCRTRGGMSVADVLAYAPEHAPVIRLRRLRVPADRWYGTVEPVLYAHPWQADRLRERHPFLVDDGETGPARPLMSLRTVAPVDGGPHVKTAVDVQMTSAVRTVSPAAVHNGPRLSALLRRITVDLPIDVLAETDAGAVLVDGQPQRHLAYLRREAPRLGAGERAVPLGVLGAVPMLLSTVIDAYDFFALLGDVLFTPLIAVLDRGVALEAHGQNTLVVLRDGRPVRSLYRDLGGVRVSAARLRAAGIEPPELHGDLPSDDPRVLRTKLAAAAFGTVAAELIAAFGRQRGADPHRLWAIVGRAVRRADTADARHLLRDRLPVKATTAMRLAADPLEDVWAHVDNPMAAAG